MTKVTGIEAERGIAALLVVAMHTRGHLLQAFGPSSISKVFEFGHIGVDFFFVLSGFIILHVHASDVGKPSALVRYLQRRFTRVFPFYWGVLVLSLVLVAVKHPLPSTENLISSTLLLPLPVDLPLPVAWSLQHEVVFYVLFAALIVNRDVGLMLLGGWFTLIVCDLFVIGSDPTAGVLVNVHSVFDGQFFLGMLAAALLRRVRIPFPRSLLIFGAAAFFGLGVAEDMHFVRALASTTHLGYGLAAMLIVLGTVEAERQGRLRTPRPLVAVGRASYALYLTHLLTIGVLWQVFLACGVADTLPMWIEFTILVAASVGVGLAASWAMEAPLIAFTRGLLVSAGLHVRPVFDRIADEVSARLRAVEHRPFAPAEGRRSPDLLPGQEELAS